jgi:short-subunit dehydrogenase
MSKRQGRTVLITGASSGIGRATALYLAERGYSVIGTSRSLGRLESLRIEAGNQGTSVTCVELDINSDEAVDAVLPRLIEEHGVIDALVNNAGYGVLGPVEYTSMADLKSGFETNFFAVVRLIKAVLPGMTREGRGTIVNVGSVLGRLGTPFNSAYVSSKFAVEGLSESLRVELWPLGIRVAVVEPGAVRTNFHQNQVVSEGVEAGGFAYSSFVNRLAGRHTRLEKLAADPIKVSKVIHKIIRARRRPALRHPVGPDARLGMLAARLMPERLFQTLLSRATMR